MFIEKNIFAEKMETHHKIEVKPMPEMHVAAVESIGVQNIENAYNTLISWGMSKNLFSAEPPKMISVYHNSFKDTPADKVKIHACLLLPEPIKQEGNVFPETLSSGNYIVGRYQIGLEDFGKTWESLFLWMTENGYQYKKTPPYEIYHNNYKDHPEKKCLVDFCIPVL